MRKAAVLAVLFTFLLGSLAMAAAVAPQPTGPFSGATWTGNITYQTDSEAPPETIPVVIFFGPAGGPNNSFVAGTIAADAGDTLPGGFPTTFSAVIGPFSASFAHMTAPDTIMLADAFRRGRAHKLGIRGSIVGGPLAGTTFMGVLSQQ